MRILFAGVGYFPWLTSGEKNFFMRLFPILHESVELAVFSLNDYSEDLLFQTTDFGQIPIYCARRPFHRDYERFFVRGENYISYHHRHGPMREVVEKLASTIVHLPKLRQIVREHKIDVLHFMDNFGPAMPLARMALRPVKVTYSAANYDPRGNRLNYDRYLRMSLGHLDAIGVYTQAYADQLREIGVKAPQVKTPWGVSTDNQPLSSEQKATIRQELGIADDQYLVLWSGYLQQIQETDYYKTIQVAREVVSRRSDITFVFAFKPETFREKYYTEAGKNIKVISGVKNFGDVLEAADLFFSPIGNQSSTVSPPLTWLEAMSKGTPVMTTNIGGVDEVIRHGNTGFIAQSYENLATELVTYANKELLETVSRQAQEVVRNRYNIQNSAKCYINLWNSIL